MKSVDEVVHIDEQTTVVIDDCGDMTFHFEDIEEDDEWQIEVNARDLFEHLKEFFNE